MSELAIPRACLTCAHFDLDMDSPGYSEMTPGSPVSISCDVSRQRGCAWPDYRSYPDVTPRALRSIAESCKLYEVHEDLK